MWESTSGAHFGAQVLDNLGAPGTFNKYARIGVMKCVAHDTKGATSLLKYPPK